jgi:hypothetical protein
MNNPFCKKYKLIIKTKNDIIDRKISVSEHCIIKINGIITNKKEFEKYLQNLDFQEKTVITFEDVTGETYLERKNDDSLELEVFLRKKEEIEKYSLKENRKLWYERREYKLKYTKNEDLIKLQDKVLKKKTSSEMFQEAFETYSTRNCFGEKIKDEMKWYTYKEIYDKLLRLSHSLKNLISRDEKIGLCSVNLIEWFIGDIATLFLGIYKK